MDRTGSRKFRRGCFKMFADDARANFMQIAQRDPDHASLDSLYGFHVIHGGRQGGMKKEIVEVFYGNRPYDETTEMMTNSGEFSRPRQRLLVETGAALIYERVDNGSVLVTLVPAQSERFRRKEDMVLLAWIRNPQKLTGLPVLERHWRVFSSYMEYTSLDGLPTATDKLRVWWMLFTRTLVVRRREQIPTCLRYAGQIISFALTIGLSGFLLQAVNWYFRSPN